MSQQTLLVLAPHPDDAEFYAGGTIARYVQEGMKAVIVVATDGRCGSFELPSEHLVPLRAEEAARAAKIMGAEPPILLGHPDMGLDKLPAGFLREQFIRLIRQYQPHLTISEDPSSTDEVHPDHRAVAWAAAEAVTFASLPLVHPEHLAQGLKPHFTPQKYFYSESPITDKQGGGYHFHHGDKTGCLEGTQDPGEVPCGGCQAAGSSGWNKPGRSV